MAVCVCRGEEFDTFGQGVVWCTGLRMGWESIRRAVQYQRSVACGISRSHPVLVIAEGVSAVVLWDCGLKEEAEEQGGNSKEIN